MNKTTLLTAYLVIALLFCGCSGTPPDHCANWWYYWKDGNVVTDMDKVKYLWEDPTSGTIGVSSPHKSQEIIGISDLVLAPYTNAPIKCLNKNDPTISVTLTASHAGGIDSVAKTIAHEFKHIWVYEQWGAKIKETGLVDGRQHSDGDGIPDEIEVDRTAGSIGEKYRFSHIDADTFGLVSVGGNWSVYLAYGDSEVLARIEGVTNPRASLPEKDWSKEGKQWKK